MFLYLIREIEHWSIYAWLSNSPDVITAEQQKTEQKNSSTETNSLGMLYGNKHNKLGGKKNRKKQSKNHSYKNCERNILWRQQIRWCAKRKQIEYKLSILL